MRRRLFDVTKSDMLTIKVTWDCDRQYYEGWVYYPGPYSGEFDAYAYRNQIPQPVYINGEYVEYNPDDIINLIDPYMTDDLKNLIAAIPKYAYYWMPTIDLVSSDPHIHIRAEASQAA